MKSSITKVLNAKPIFICLIMVGLYVVSAPTLQAQSTQSSFNSGTVPNGPYVTPAVAISKVEAKILLLKEQYEILNPNTQEYTYNEIKYSLYTALLNNLNAGKTVKESLESAIPILSIDASSALPKTKREEYKQEAINLLRA